MLFSSLTFILVFLPFNIIAVHFLPLKGQNILLLATSLLFYSWGEPEYIFLMLASITANWLFGLLIDRYRRKATAARLLLAAAVVFNLGLLFYYKYFNFFISTVAGFVPVDFSEIPAVALPLGISFYTFQSLSYIIDLYRGSCDVQKSWINVSLYISFFPQLVAGPIVRYDDVNRALSYRELTVEKTAYGLKRFVYGLSKKVILSNYFGLVTDTVYGLPAAAISTPLAWLVALLYALQIYFDFSGYSDMAIGLGSVFGFHFPENFNYPFVSTSVQEFWRRWHISLSTWFREYLYIPLGGNRRGKLRTYINLFIVFFATGFWHGASWQFVVWGLVHGIFMVWERVYFSKILSRKEFKPFGFVYTAVEVLATFVIFRAPGLRYAIVMLKNMFVPSAGSAAYPVAQFVDARLVVFVAVGVLLSGFLQEKLPRLKQYIFSREVHTLEMLYLPLLYFICIVSLVSSTYNPFIYFRF